MSKNVMDAESARREQHKVTENPIASGVYESTDCLGCKLTSFFGLTASGVYVAYHANKQPNVIAKGVLSTCAIGLVYLGVARLAKLPPFPSRSQSSLQVDN